MNSIVKLIGNTPLVELTSFKKNDSIKIIAKLEGYNPGGSVKDRAAYWMIKGAIERGELRKGIKLVEATSGNTGIALAMIARLFEFDIELIMPENSTRERVLTMQAYGAKVILTPKEKSMEGAIDLAHEKVKSGGYVMLNQFANPDNPKAHYESTGPEIWNSTNGRITHFVSSMGTTGTIMGVSRYLKKKNPDVKIIGAQPTDGSHIPGIRRWPKEYLPKIFNPQSVDRVIDVSEDDAIKTTRRLAIKEAIFAGMSSGGAAWVAQQIASEIDEGLIVCIICDCGDRYLSSNLFG